MTRLARLTSVAILAAAAGAVVVIAATARLAPTVGIASPSLLPATGTDAHGRTYRVVDLGRPDVAPPPDQCPMPWRFEIDTVQWVCYDGDYRVLDRLVNPLLVNAMEAARYARDQSDCLARFPGFGWGPPLTVGGGTCRPAFDRGPDP